MTAKTYLSEIRTYKRAMQSLELKCAELRAKASGVGAIVYDKDKVQVSPVNMMESVVAELVETEKRYESAIAEYHEAILIRTEQITELGNPLFSELLILKYVHDLPLKEVADILHERHPQRVYGEDYIRRLHGWALKAFWKKYLKK